MAMDVSGGRSGSGGVLAATALALAVAILCLAVGCDAREAESARVPDGDIARGRELIVQYGCSSCHTIPGIRQARGLIGPPLTDWSDRIYIAGRLINEPDNLILWIQRPQDVDPGNAMPDMGVTIGDARDIAAYLYTLQRDGRRASTPGEGAAGANAAGATGIAIPAQRTGGAGIREADDG